jgi:Spy/CpxP family protein refolding chaperone
MRKILFLTLIAASGMSFAKSNGSISNGPGKGKRQAKMENLTPEQRADKMTAKMKKELDLTADQEKQVKASNLEFAQQQEAIRMKSEALKSERKALDDAHRAKMKGILTPEQQAKADQMMKKRQEKRSEKRRERRQSMGR